MARVKSVARSHHEGHGSPGAWNAPLYARAISHKYTPKTMVRPTRYTPSLQALEGIRPYRCKRREVGIQAGIQDASLPSAGGWHPGCQWKIANMSRRVLGSNWTRVRSSDAI
jgi:hypothetical protein